MEHPSQPEHITVEADTVEQALEQVSRRLGPHAEIVGAERATRGGIAGFFAKEVVVVTARLSRGASAQPNGVAGALAALTDTQSAHDGFAAALDRHVGTPSRPSAPTTPEPDIPGTGPVRWSTNELAALGLPTHILEATVGLDPSDDLQWIKAVAAAVGTSCRPLPAGSFAMAGRTAGRLGAVLELPTVSFPQRPPYGGSIAAILEGDEQELAWLHEVRGDRWVHVVVDGVGAHPLVGADPLAVSWTGEAAAAQAVAIAVTTGAVLGYGMSASRGARAFRATPLDVALAIRSALERA